MTDKLRILVSGRIGGALSQGGAAWAVLQYVLGLSRLGHEVWLAEPIQRQALLPAGADLARSRNAACFSQLMSRFDLEGRAALFEEESLASAGLSWPELRAAARRCDLLINLSGLLRDPELMQPIPVRLYADLDPAYTQLWQDVEGIDMGFRGHTRYATVGMALGQASCPIPLCGLDWIPTLQPLVLECWPAIDSPPRYGWTTVANWRSYGSVEFEGRFYGQRVHSWRDFMDLPERIASRAPGESLQPALSIHPQERDDLRRLADQGWQWLDPAQLADDPDRYQSFIQHSKGELGIAKSGYVASRCGWFSDRSICYLASGRPVLAQDTGWDAFLPSGEGLFNFRTSQEAAEAIGEIQSSYPRHCQAARRIAAEHFDSDRVLSRLLQKVGCGA